MGFNLNGSLIHLLTCLRNAIDDYHGKWYKEALELAKIFNIDGVVPRAFSTQILKESSEYHTSDSSSEY